MAKSIHKPLHLARRVLQDSKIQARQEQRKHSDLKYTSFLAEGRNFKIQLWDPSGGRVSLHYFSIHVLGRTKNLQSTEVNNTGAPSPAVFFPLPTGGSPDCYCGIAPWCEPATQMARVLFITTAHLIPSDTTASFDTLQSRFTNLTAPEQMMAPTPFYKGGNWGLDP